MQRPKLAEGIPGWSILCLLSLECLEGWKPQKALSWCLGCGRRSGAKEALLQPVPLPGQLPAHTPGGHLQQMDSS